MFQYYSKQWEIEHSSLYKQNLIQKMIAKNLSYEQCRIFSQIDIANKLTKVDISKPILEIGPNEKFCFLGRVDTYYDKVYNTKEYYNKFKTREFVGFSTITQENISHYEHKNINNIMLAYNVPAEAIAHVFPCDSNTFYNARTDEKLSKFPSLWWTLNELNDYTKNLKTYNQVTCKTKINGKILKPSALIVFNTLTEEAKTIAKKFNINIIIIHTNQSVISYNTDLLKDKKELDRVSEILYKDLGIDYFYYPPYGFF